MVDGIVKVDHLVFWIEVFVYFDLRVSKRQTDAHSEQRIHDLPPKIIREGIRQTAFERHSHVNAIRLSIRTSIIRLED